MNKTVTINLGGIVFHIEENAYDALSRYLQTIKSYFSDSDGRDEIMTDIENRIAEMLASKVSKNKQAVLMNDVDEVIANMGKPEDFAGDASKEKKEETPVTPAIGSKRIFRDPDSKILGGVCSGIGYYFGFDPLWLRLAWVLLFFLAGTGLLLYIILWIIMPAAKTTAEKLEMRGEPVTAENIGKKVEEELNEFKKTMNDFSNKAKNIKQKNFVSKSVDGIVQLLGMLLKTIGKIFGIVLLFIGAILAVVFAAMFFGEKSILSITPEGVNYFSYSGITEMIFGTSDISIFATIGLILLIGIPIIGIFYGGLKLLFGIKNELKPLGIALTILWFVGVILCGISGFSLVSDFSEKGTFEKNISVIQPQNNTLYLDIDDELFDDQDHHSKHDFHLKINDSSAFIGNVNLNIKKSESDSFEMKINFISRGETTKEAIDLAKNVNYGFSQQDSLLKFNTYYGISNQKWRNQKVKIELKVPEGKSVFLSGGMQEIIYDVENITNTLDEDMVGKKWTMTKEGLSSENLSE